MDKKVVFETVGISLIALGSATLGGIVSAVVVDRTNKKRHEKFIETHYPETEKNENS